MNKRISHILILLLLLSVSCTYNWHREFLLGKKAEIPTAQNWRLKIDLFAYKNVAGDEMPRTPNDYYFSIRCFNANKKDGPLITKQAITQHSFLTRTIRKFLEYGRKAKQSH